MKLTPGDAPRLTAAVGAAESKTAAEVVVVVQPRSGTYADLSFIAGLLSATAALLAVLFVDLEFDELVVAPVVAGAGVIGFALAALVLVPRFVGKGRSRRQVDDAAHATFSRYGVHRTSARTGILVFYSLQEQAGRILVDTGVAAAVPADVRDRWKARLHEAADGDALGVLVEDIGAECGRYLPRSADDVNELADAAHVAQQQQVVGA